MKTNAVFLANTQTETQAQRKSKGKGLNKHATHIDNEVITNIPVTVSREAFAEIISDFLTTFVDGEVANIQAIRDFSTSLRSFRFTNIESEDGLADWFSFDTDYSADIELLHDYAEKKAAYTEAFESGETDNTFEQWLFGDMSDTIRNCCDRLAKHYPDMLHSYPCDYKVNTTSGATYIHFLNDDWFRFTDEGIGKVKPKNND